MELLSSFKTKHLQNSEFSPSFMSFQPKLLVVGVLFCFALLYFVFFYDKVQRLNHLLLYLPVSHNGVNECRERCFVLAERQITTHTLLLVQVLETFSFSKSLKYFFSKVNRSAVLFKEVFPTERLCHSCERWWVALTTYTFRNKLGITAKESSSEPLISAEVSM